MSRSACKAAEIAKYDDKNGTTLKEAAVGLGHVSEAEYDDIVDPSKMIGHYATNFIPSGFCVYSM